MKLPCKRIAIVGHSCLEPFKRAEASIRHTVRRLASGFPGALWLARRYVGADRIAVDELLELDQRVRLMVSSGPSFLVRQPSTTCRRSVDEQIALVESVEKTGHVVDQQKRIRRLLQSADLLVAFWDGVPFGSATVATIYEAYQRDVPVYWVPLR